MRSDIESFGDCGLKEEASEVIDDDINGGVTLTTESLADFASASEIRLVEFDEEASRRVLSR
jgi:hypothetical protein